MVLIQQPRDNDKVHILVLIYLLVSSRIYLFIFYLFIIYLFILYLITLCVVQVHSTVEWIDLTNN